VKNALVIAFLSIVLGPICINTGVFSYYSIDIKSFTEKYCVNKAEPELRCNGKCKLNSIIVAPVNTSKDNKSKVNSLKIPFFLDKPFAYVLRPSLSGVIQKGFQSVSNQLIKVFQEISTPPPQSLL
jgi:hypothetical protein